MKRGYLRYSLIGIFIICVSALLTSCGTGSGGDDGVGTTTSITLSASPDTIPTNGGSATIQVTLTDATGQAVDTDTSVTFSTTLGRFANGSTSYTVKTPDNTGTVRVSLIAGTTVGQATVTAQANGVTQTVTVFFSGEGPPGVTAWITLTASPDTIPADGGSSSAITAQLKDSSGDPVSSGTSVTFSATFGRFSNGSTSYTVTTPGDTGTVIVSLIAGTIPGIATVTATSSGVTQRVTVEFTTDPAGPGSTASITLIANPNTIQANGSSSSAITATLTDSTGSPVATGTTVTFATTLGTMSAYVVQTPNDTGIVTVSLISGTTPGNAIVTASSGGVSQTVVVMFTGEDIPATPRSLSLSLSQASVKSDNSDSSTITAVVLDSNNAVIKGIMVTFTSNGGQLSAPNDETDDNGEAKVVFSSGTTDKSNRVVLITATVSGLTPRQIPVQVTGTTLSLSTDTTNLEIGGQNQAILTITARDAGLVPIYDAQVTITANPLNRVQLNPSTGNTDVSGKLVVIVTGTQAGIVTVQVAALGTTATQNYTVGAVGAVFTIIHPATDPYSWHTAAPLATTGPLLNVFSFNDNALLQDTITRNDFGNFGADGFAVDDEIMVVGSQSNDGVYTIANVIPATLTLVASDSLTTEADNLGFTVTITNGVLIRVNAPNQTWVEFATTLGAWDGGPNMVLNKPVDPVTLEAEAILSSNQAGVANILVSDVADPSTQDSLVVTFSAPSSEASQISLQASATVVAPSVGGVTNSVTLTATVKNLTDQVVGGAPVAFSIENPTGGGEYVSPPIVYTNDFGIAESTFTSGSLSSDAQGVTVRASLVINPAITDTIAIVIGGTAGSVVIGRSTSIYSINNDTAYELPMSVLVSDSNGNPMTNTIVSLSAWPSHYQRGVWAEDPVTGECSLVYWGAAAGATTGSLASIAFNDVNPDTITRIDAGSFITDGFVNGDYIWVTGSLNNDGYYTISTVAAATLTLVAFDTLTVEVPGAFVTINAVGWISNEDDFYGVGDNRYRNLILDLGEDANMDGQLTPPNSAAGSVPATVETDINGVGTFSLIYLKSSAAWIEDEITASTLVYGTETQGTYIFVLPYSQEDADDCVLPNSPYN